MATGRIIEPRATVVPEPKSPEPEVVFLGSVDSGEEIIEAEIIEAEVIEESTAAPEPGANPFASPSVADPEDPDILFIE